jgi:hypothetical protein
MSFSKLPPFISLVLTVLTPDIDVLKSVPNQTLKMVISKQQRLRLGIEIVFMVIGCCQDASLPPKSDSKVPSIRVVYPERIPGDSALQGRIPET